MGYTKMGPRQKTREMIEKFLRSMLTVKEFAKREGLNEHTVRITFERHGVMDKKHDIETAAMRAVEDKLKTDLEAFYLDMASGQIELWTKVKQRANEMLDKGVIRSGDLVNLTTAIEKMLKSYRLMEGKSTENVQSKNLHLAAVEIIESVKNGTIPTNPGG